MFLVVHDPEVVVVASAEHAFRYNLVFAFSSSDNPYGPAAGIESVTGDVSSVNNSKSRSESFVENFGEHLLLLLR